MRSAKNICTEKFEAVESPHVACAVTGGGGGALQSHPWGGRLLWQIRKEIFDERLIKS
jgi:hypothetical protein